MEAITEEEKNELLKNGEHIEEIFSTPYDDRYNNLIKRFEKYKNLRNNSVKRNENFLLSVSGITYEILSDFQNAVNDYKLDINDLKDIVHFNQIDIKRFSKLYYNAYLEFKLSEDEKKEYQKEYPSFDEEFSKLKETNPLIKQIYEFDILD